MGYDMRAVDAMTEDERQAHDLANAEFRAACRARDDAYPQEARPSYTLRSNSTEADVARARSELAAMWPGEVIVEAKSDFGPELRTARYHELQERVHRAYLALDASDVTYFRLNIWGMGIAREMLYELGMAHDECEDAAPPWPELADFGLDERPDEVKVGDKWYDHRQRPDLFTDAQLAFLKAQDEKRSWSPEVPGIPIWKFGSNDGWHVTPVDIQGALRNLGAKAEAQGVEPEALVAKVTAERPSVGKFIEWMGHMVERGGFRVY